MIRPSRKNRRRLLALAAIGLVSLSSPALAAPHTANDNVTSADTAGLAIVADDATGTKVTWNGNDDIEVSSDTGGTGLVFMDDGDPQTPAGPTKLILSGSNKIFKITNGDIVNNNRQADSIIEMRLSGSQLLIENGDIIGNSDSTLKIQIGGTPDAMNHISVRADQADVRGNVDFEDLNVNNTGRGSIVQVKNIGGEGAATVNLGGADKITLNILENFGGGGGSELNLNNMTRITTNGAIASIGGNIGGSGSLTEATKNVINMADQSTLKVLGKAVGYLDAENANTANNSFSVGTLGDLNAPTNLSLSGTINVEQLAGTVSIKSLNTATKRVDSVYLGTIDPNTKVLTPADIGSATQTEKIDLTLRGHDDPNFRTDPTSSDADLILYSGNIYGGETADKSTSINIDTTGVSINDSQHLNVSGHVNVKLIGESAKDLAFNELTQGSTFTFDKDEPEDPATAQKKTVIFESVNKTDSLTPETDTVNIINKSKEAVKITKLYDGILNVGSGGAPDVVPETASVVVEELDKNKSFEFGSFTGDYGQVTLNMDNANMAADFDDASSATKIKLANAVLKIAESTDAHTDLGKNDSFMMDSTKGDSRLIGESGSATALDNRLIFSQAPTIEVGAGGDVIIESQSLSYIETLKSAKAADLDTEALPLIGSGVVHFANAANGNKMIFKSSDATNTFTSGVRIEEGNWEFQGGTNIQAQEGDTFKNSQVYFTGNSVIDSNNDKTVDGAGDDPVSKFNITSKAIDATGSTLNLNKYVNIANTGGGSLENLDTVKLGGLEGAKTNISFGDGTNNTVLKAAHIATGYYEGAPIAATVDSVFIGKLDDIPVHPDSSKTVIFDNGLQGTDITLDDKVLVEGGLYVDANGTMPVLKIGRAEGGLMLTDNAVSANSYIEKDSVVQISETAFNESKSGVNKIQLLSATEGSSQAPDYIAASLVPNLKLDTTNLGESVEATLTSDGQIYYARTGEVLTAAVPKFARPMVDALNAVNDLRPVATYFGTSAASSKVYNRELTQVMGNTMNSSLSLIQNGTAHAFTRLNAAAPTIVGYNTAVAVSAPRRQAAGTNIPAPAPSPAIGVPLRATDLPGAAPAPGSGLPSAPMAPAFGGEDGRPNGFWISPNYSQLSMKGDYKEGYGDFDVKSMGLVMGVDKWVNENARLGAFMSYASPELSGDFQDIKADDIQMGVYAQGVAPNGIIINGALAMGRQDYNSKRNIRLSGVDMGDYNQELKAEYGGKTISAALEASRPVALENNMYLRPSASYSYQNISLNDVKESTNVAQAKSLAQKISSDTFNIQQVRLGADIGWVNPDNSLTVNGRAFLVANVGDTQPEGRASFISAGSGALPFTVRGAEMDSTVTNLGLGLKFTPGGTEGLVISLDYDALLGGNTTGHNLGLMVRYEF